MVAPLKTIKHDAIILSSMPEVEAQESLSTLLRGTPIPPDELLANLGLYLTSKTLSRLLFFFEIYKRILSHHGVIMEFGVRYGQTLSLLSALRGILEPFNRHRKIIGFDTFEGFRGMSGQDGVKCNCQDGSFSVPEGYENHLTTILSLQEALNPMGHIKRFELVKGDVCQTVPDYFSRHPESIVSLAIFDLDIYAPTKTALQTVRPYLTPGSIMVFDELSDEYFPGETIALRECFDTTQLRIQRLPTTARLSFAEIL